MNTTQQNDNAMPETTLHEAGLLMFRCHGTHQMLPGGYEAAAESVRALLTAGWTLMLYTHAAHSTSDRCGNAPCECRVCALVQESFK